MVAQPAEANKQKRIKSSAKNSPSWSDRVSLFVNPAYRLRIPRMEGSMYTPGVGIPHSNYTDLNTYTAFKEHLNSFDTSGMWEGI